MRRRVWLSTLVGLLAATLCHAEVTLQLNNSFIRAYKDRATIETPFIPDHVTAVKKPSASKPSNDGDIHVSGRASMAQLPLVSELMNAADLPSVVSLFKDTAGSGHSIPIVGVWRIWCEHGGSTVFTQGAQVPIPDSTNPDHVFEIHPLVTVGDTDVRSTFHGIEGFTYKKAEEAFPLYENVRSKIIPGTNTTTIQTSMAGFNYVEFKIRPRLSTIINRSDGRTVRASIFDVGGELLVRDRRMVFVNGTEPNNKLGSLSEGQCMHVLGMPRISLTLVNWRTSQEGQARGALDWNLPYEMVILGVLSDSTDCEADE